ncbi:MAG TPA: phosphoribosylformylglycinamidine cyclo-ligase [Mycobacteriales bacterium]|nr:phosphoribosylformylglycinamidine cyclo-ligase [Mycobacteriales bacterium]
MSDGPISYADAGVDIDAGERAVELMKSSVAKATRPEVVGGLGGFAGLFKLDLTKYREPLLASSTDGVGTKIAIAQAMGIHHTVGIDLVAMVVDDLVVCGAEPLFLQDYIACGRVDPERIASIVSGIAEGCRRSGCALVGGETAEHPGLMEPDHYDLAATGVGVVEAADVLGPERVRSDDVVIAMASSGLHSNGYSLVRHVLLERSGVPIRTALEAEVPELGGRRLGDELLVPTRLYTLPCLSAIRAAGGGIHGFSHVTGGGLADNLARVIPPHLDAEVDRASWTVPPVFRLVAERGQVPTPEIERTLNMGVGMVALVAPDAVDVVLQTLAQHDVPAWVAGRVLEGTGAVRLVGDHPA